MKALFSLKSCHFPQCRPRSKIRLRKHRPTIALSKTQKIRSKRRSKAASNTSSNPDDGKPAVSKVRIAELLTVLFSLRKLPKEVETDTTSEQDISMTDVSVSDKGHGKEPFPSPTTPAYVKDRSEVVEEVVEVESVLCRSFETKLVEMMVEEGKVKDLIDVEELLHCWKSLKSPIFVDLVCRFYGEVCEDLFSEEDESHATSVSD